MRKNFGSKPYVYPQPVFMIGTYNPDGTADLMTAGWGGISEWDEITIGLSKGHQTNQNILKRGAFTVSMATADFVKECDYLGIVSAKDVPDKIERAGFHAERSEFVDAPLFRELPMALECQVVSYDVEACHLIGKIINVCADETILDDQGKICPEKLNPLIHDTVHHTYRTLGPVVGHSFHDGAEIKNKKND